MIRILLIAAAVCLLYANSAFSQTLYVSKQTGQFTTYQGQNGKTTDRYENGNVNIQVEGPLQWSVLPNELQIGPNQTKNWQGKVWPNVAAAPAPGNSVDAKIKGNYVVNYSRPAGGGGDGAVTGTYQCVGDMDAPCPTHGSTVGNHELVQKNGVYEVPFTVYSIKAAITNNPTCVNGFVTLDAEIFPPHGTTTWTTPFGVFTGNNLTVAVPPGFAGGNITVTLNIDGVTYSDTKVMPPNLGTLNTFATTQMCIGDTTTAPAVTQVTFLGGCPANNLIYTPLSIGPPSVVAVSTIPLSVTSGGITRNASIQGVNKNKTVTQAISINFGAGGQTLVDNIAGAFESALSGTGSPCSRSGSWIPAGQFSRATFSECCVTSIKSQVKYEGQVNWSPGIGCRFPFYGIPYIASIDFLVNAGVNVSLAVNGTTQCTGPAQICATATATASLGVGVGGTVLSGFITADLMVVVDGISCEVQYCFTPPPMAGTMKATLGKVKLVGTLSGGWGLASYSIEYPVLDGYTTPTFNF